MTSAAEQKNLEDVDRQVSMLTAAYRRVGMNEDVQLVREDSTKRGHFHWTLRVGGAKVTDWIMLKPGDVWLYLFDMRRAIEVLDRPDDKKDAQ